MPSTKPPKRYPLMRAMWILREGGHLDELRAVEKEVCAAMHAQTPRPWYAKLWKRITDQP